MAGLPRASSFSLAPRKKFTGTLAKPLKFELAESKYKPMLEVIEKLDLLFEHYSIQPHSTTHDLKTIYDSWCWLALKLALDFVPGFQIVVPKKRGRKMDLVTPVLLIVDVAKARAKHRCSVIDAIRRLV